MEDSDELGGEDEGLRGRLARSGEDAIGRLAQELLENPLVNGAISRAFEARERATQAQEAAFGALNIPSAADLERLTRRLRSVSQRLEGIEDGVDRLDTRLEGLHQSPGIEGRLLAIEAGVDRVAARLQDADSGDALADRMRSLEKAVGKGPGKKAADQRLAGLEKRLDALLRELRELRQGLATPREPVPRKQKRLPVDAAED